MIYIDNFNFPSVQQEESYNFNIVYTCYSTIYPFYSISRNGLSRLDFSDITILYGTNGSGKSTALNVIAEKLNLKRESVFNKTNFYDDYVELCDFELEKDIPENSRIITSDDVFDYMLNIRNINNGVDLKREELFDEYMKVKKSDFQLKSMADYDQLKKVNRSRKLSKSGFVKEELGTNIRTFSNGESAFKYFTEKLEENALYILDEPENSLSPDNQLRLKQYIEEAVRFFGCQFIISTHSPFLLSIDNAKIYDLDENPVNVKNWTELSSVKTYIDFFKNLS